MTERIIKDIRYYESNVENVEGHYPSDLGDIYIKTNDTKYIGQRIARKLNELKFVAGEFDHIYINLTTVLKDNEIVISDRFIDNWIKYIDFGLSSNLFNTLGDSDKDLLINEITFKSLLYLNQTDSHKLQCITDTKTLIDKFYRQIVIGYKTKDTSTCRINVSFQIRPYDDMSKMIVEYIDKKDNHSLQATIDILDYEDLYSLVDNVSLKDGFIIFQPKKSYHAELVAKKYDNPLINIEINKMIKNNCHQQRV